MRSRTRFFGEIEVDEEDVIVFPDGVLGFEDSRRFILLDIPGQGTFKILQDADREYVSFVVTDPWTVVEKYEINVPDEELLKINIRKKEDLLVLGIVNLAGELEKSTVNLLAPILINTNSKLGRQYVLNGGTYKIKHSLFPKAGGENNAGSQQKSE